MSIIGKIQGTADSLTPSEKRLISTIVDSPRTAALATVSDLARGADVHEATVSRLVRKLGFGGYASFRQALQDEFIPTQETATRFERTLDQTSQDSILGNLVEQEIGALNRVTTYVSSGAIVVTATRLMAARRIFIFGRGNAETLAILMLKRLRRFGLDVHQLSGDMRDLAEQVLSFRPGDVVLAFAFRRPPRGFGALIESARESGAESIVIAGLTGAMLAPTPDILISAPRAGEQDAFQTLTVPMTVCNAIILAAGAQQKGRSLRTLDQLGELIKRFE